MNLMAYEKAAKTFKETLCTFEINSPDSFYNAIFYGLIFKLSTTKNKKKLNKILMKIRLARNWENILLIS